MESKTLTIPGLPHAAVPSNSRPHTQAKGCRLLPWRNQIRLALIAASVTVCVFQGRAVAQVALPTFTLVQVSGPAQAYPTEQISLCYSALDYPYVPENSGGSSESGGGSFSPKKAKTVTLRIVDAGSHSEVAKKVISVAPGALPGDPCLEYVVPAATTTSSGLSAISVTLPATPAYIGVVSVSSQPLPPSAVSSSLQIFTLGPNGLPVNPRIVPPSVTCPADQYPCSY